MEKKTNFLVILTDDLGFGDLGCYGNTEIKTPNLDRLAKMGTAFTQFHVASPVCSPSRCAFITGQYPARHNIHGHFAVYTLNEQREMPNWLSLDCTTLPRLLKGAGYKTAHYGKWHLGGGGGMHGHPDAPKPAEYGYDDTRVWNGNGPTWVGQKKFPFAVCNDDDEEFLPYSDKLAADEVINFIEENKDEPFYIDYWLRTPHTPHRATEEQREPYKNVPEPKQTYYSIVTYADKQIGRVLDKLEELNLMENTVIVFTSDNGPESPHPKVRMHDTCQGSTGGLRGRKRSLYEGGIKTPFIAAWKGHIKENTYDFDSLISSVDLLPTFCSIAGVDLPEGYQPDGEVITDALLGKDYTREKTLYWEWIPADRSLDSKECPAQAIRKGDYVLLKNPDNRRIELYDVKKDHAQLCNVKDCNPELVEEMKKELDRWAQELPECSQRV